MDSIESEREAAGDHLIEQRLGKMRGPAGGPLPGLRAPRSRSTRRLAPRPPRSASPPVPPPTGLPPHPAAGTPPDMDRAPASGAATSCALTTASKRPSKPTISNERRTKRSGEFETRPIGVPRSLNELKQLPRPDHRLHPVLQLGDYQLV